MAQRTFLNTPRMNQVERFYSRLCVMQILRTRRFIRSSTKCLKRKPLSLNYLFGIKLNAFAHKCSYVACLIYLYSQEQQARELGIEKIFFYIYI